MLFLDKCSCANPERGRGTTSLRTSESHKSNQNCWSLRSWFCHCWHNTCTWLWKSWWSSAYNLSYVFRKLAVTRSLDPSPEITCQSYS